MLLSLFGCVVSAQEEIPASEPAPEPAAEASAAVEEPVAEEPTEEQPDAMTEEATGESADEPTEAPVDAESLVAELKARFAAVAELLARVQNTESATDLLPEVQEAFATLLQTDAGALEDADEEELAAEFAEAFAPIDAELARLEEADFYGVHALRTVFIESEEAVETDTEDGYIFPLGPLDFLRGTHAEERHVCPRRDSSLPLFDWASED